MKNLLVLLIVLEIVMLFSCRHNVVSPKDIKNNHKTVTIDSCEYLIFSYRGVNKSYAMMTHKGNCSNPIHKSD